MTASVKGGQGEKGLCVQSPLPTISTVGMQINNLCARGKYQTREANLSPEYLTLRYTLSSGKIHKKIETTIPAIRKPCNNGFNIFKSPT